MRRINSNTEYHVWQQCPNFWTEKCHGWVSQEHALCNQCLEARAAVQNDLLKLFDHESWRRPEAAKEAADGEKALNELLDIFEREGRSADEGGDSKAPDWHDPKSDK